jgi:predicted esterase
MWLHLAMASLMAHPLSSDGDPPQTQPAIAPTTQPEVIARDLRAGNDEHKRYFLIGPRSLERPPEGGFKLLLVLPGGDGSADFQPFVQRIFENSLPEGYVVAQLVAPKWSDEQAERLVWPTKSRPLKGMKFSTEEFIDSVINDVGKQCKINPQFVFTLSWSSGGPAAYTASLTDNSRITGSFVAMSVFKPDQLPDLKKGNGKAYYILHSPQDRIPMRFAEAARDRLAEAGATTKLQTYEGGHGWHGDVFGNIRAGIKWLEQQQASAR